MFYGLTTLERVYLCLVGVMVGLLLVWAAGIVLAEAVLLVHRKAPPPRKAWLKWTRRIVVVAGGVIVTCLLYARFVEPYWMEITHVTLHSAKLPVGAQPLRILHISDLHCEKEARLEDAAAGAIEAARPDLIIFTGDSINYPEALPTFQAFIRRIAKVAPIYGVRGNWDFHFDLNPFRGTEIHEPLARAETITIRGQKVCIAGALMDHAETIPPALAALDNSAYTIMLYHSPDVAPRAAQAGADLYLAGHTHGGQVRLPWYGAMITLSGTGKRFEAGQYRLGETDIYVNRGLGTEGYHVPPLRFLCRPEVTLIEVWPRAKE